MVDEIDMKIATILIQNAIRILGLVLIILGFLFWTHHSLTLVPLHMRLGITLVVLLWVLAVLAIRAKVNAGLIIVSICWGLLVATFGMRMGTFLPGRSHEIIRVLHFLIGLGAMGFSESLAVRIRKSMPSRV
jgi:hypothetical protein